MRKLFLIIAILSFVVMASAQSRIGKLSTVTADTIQGAETVNFTITNTTGSYTSLSISALCTDDFGGTSDGTLTLYGSLDNSNWVFVNGAADGHVVTASPKASLTGTDMNQITITNTLVANWTIKGTPFRYYRIAGVGTSGDTTLINITYMYK